MKNDPTATIHDLDLEAELGLKQRAMDEAPIGITITDPTRDDNPLIYVNDSFEQLTGYSRDEIIGQNCRFLQGEKSDPESVSSMRNAIADERPVSVELVNYRKNGNRFWNSVDVVPIRNPDGEVTNYVGFQTDITKRKKADARAKRRAETVRQERKNLEQVLDRINGLVQDITAGLVHAVSRDAIERIVCDRLTDPDAFALAWIGEQKPDTTFQLNCWAGNDDVDLTQRDIETELTEIDADRNPIVRAIETQQIQRVTDATDELSATWLQSSKKTGIVDVEERVIVPLVYRETLYGVLVVYVTRSNVLNERETTVLEALGRAIATAINARESTQIISADNTIDVELEIRDRDFFVVDLSERADCRMEYEGGVSQSDGSLLMFFTTDGDSSAISALVSDVPEIETATLSSEGDQTTLFEFDVSGGSIVSMLAERGAKTRSITAASGKARIEVELPSGADTRTIVERLREQYPETELISYHERERPPTTKREFIDDVKTQLTDRQQTAIQMAYLSGFYDRNRSTSGDELAASMDISRATFHQHLRAAERKLTIAFFE